MATELTNSSSLISVAPESLHTFINRYLSLFSITALIASLFTTGLISFELFTLSVNSWDLAIILLAVNAALLLAIHDRSRIRVSRPIVFLAVLFGLWVLIGAIRSPQEFRGLTMAVLLLRDYVMVFSLIVVLTLAVPLRNLNKTMFVVGVLMALLGLVLYFPYADIENTRRPTGSIIILIDEFNVPRLTGLTNDPNFFTLAALMSIVFVLAFNFTWRNAWVVLGVAVIALAFIVTFSRSGYAALFASVVSLFLLAILQRTEVQKRQMLLYLVILSVVPAITFLSVSRLELNHRRSVLELTEQRFDVIENSPRFALWRDLLDNSGGSESPDDPSLVSLPAVDNGNSQGAIVETPVSVTPTALATSVASPTPAASPTPIASPAPSPTVQSEPTAMPTISSGDVKAPEPITDEVPKPDTVWSTVFGNGLRSNEVRLGTYSHSSYLDVSEEMGIVGVALWGAIALAVGVLLIRHSKNKHYIPWLLAYAVVLVMMSSLSMLFMPYFWIIAAVAIYASGSEQLEEDVLAA